MPTRTGEDMPRPAGTPPPSSGGGGEGLLDRLTPDAVSDLTDGITAVRAWVSDRHNWVRAAWFLSGTLLFGVGAAMLAGTRATTAASMVMPTGKVAKLAMGAMK